jgi:hypothetical protein
MDIRADLARDLAEEFEAAAGFADRSERVASITVRFGCGEDREGSFGEVLHLGEEGVAAGDVFGFDGFGDEWCDVVDAVAVERAFGRIGKFSRYLPQGAVFEEVAVDLVVLGVGADCADAWHVWPARVRRLRCRC